MRDSGAGVVTFEEVCCDRGRFCGLGGNGGEVDEYVWFAGDQAAGSVGDDGVN